MVREIMARAMRKRWRGWKKLRTRWGEVENVGINSLLTRNPLKPPAMQARSNAA